MANASLWTRPARVSQRDVSLSAPGALPAQAGFTLIELLVVCAIIIIITAIILVNNNKFGGTVTLENFAYDVALSLRQTQVYGIAVERFGTNTFNTGYGMQFTLANPNTYLLFADENGTGVYDVSATPSEIVQSNTIQTGYAITALCAIPDVNGTTCTPATEIDIVYVRPEPDAYISIGQGGGAPVSCIKNRNTACYYEAHITLTSPKGDTRDVVVDATGQISVQLQ